MATPKRAASIIVAAPISGASRACDFAVLMVKRSDKARFMPGAYVFPGGVLETADSDTAWRSLFANAGRGVTFDALHDNERQQRIGVLRELFEETNLLLSHPYIPELCESISSEQGQKLSGDLEEWRTITQKDPSGFRKMFEEAFSCYSPTGVVPDLEGIYNWGRWITPKKEKWRYDTYFYLAPLAHPPTKWTIAHQERETSGFEWLSPTEALEKFADGKIKLPVPTWLMMQEIASFQHLSALRDAAIRGRDMEPVEPIFLTNNSTFNIVLPGDKDYPGNSTSTPNSENLHRVVISNGKLVFQRSQMTISAAKGIAAL